MPPTIEQTKVGYAKMWDGATLVDELTKTSTQAKADKVADDLIKVKVTCMKVEAAIGVPWIMVAVLWKRESDLNTHAHLHNGDSLQGYTHQVPAGRPKVGHGPPFTWEESAQDALTMPGKKFDRFKGQWNVELMLFCEEGYNGWGYLSKGNSPYIWAWTSWYHGGKYIADHVYDPNTWDKQPGCAAMMKALAAKDEDAKRWCEIRSDGRVPAGAVAHATQTERKVATGGVVTAGGGTGTATTVPQPEAPGTKIAVNVAYVAVITIGLTIALIAAVLIANKAKLVKERWLGN